MGSEIAPSTVTSTTLVRFLLRVYEKTIFNMDISKREEIRLDNKPEFYL